jgi:hypothetical protein
MIKHWKYFTFFVLILPVHLFAQLKAKGFSSPGSIGRIQSHPKTIPSESGIICTVTFQEPSGDDVLNQGEKATFTIFVRNYCSNVSIRPKLEITIQSDHILKPEFRLGFMDSIEPGQAGIFTDYFSLDSQLPPGQMTYKVRVFDSASGFRSKTAQVGFKVQPRIIGEQ